MCCCCCGGGGAGAAWGSPSHGETRLSEGERERASEQDPLQRGLVRFGGAIGLGGLFLECSASSGGRAYMKSVRETFSKRGRSVTARFGAFWWSY